MFELAVIIIALALLPAAIEVAIGLFGIALALALTVGALAAVIAVIVGTSTVIHDHPIETMEVVAVCTAIAAIVYTKHIWRPYAKAFADVTTPVSNQFLDALAPFLLYSGFALRTVLGLFFALTAISFFAVTGYNYLKFGKIITVEDLQIVIPFTAIFAGLAYAMLKNIRQDFIDIRRRQTDGHR